MLTSLRKFTVIFLAIVQLIAPLVHAHTGEKSSGLGLHVPGLEMYGAEHDVLTVQVQSHDFGIDGMLIGIDAGIEDTYVNAVSDNSLYLHQQAPVVNTLMSPFDINFSPQSQQFFGRLLIPSLSPRAPPAR
ncbi:MAG: hypothetical protein ACNA7G_00155 [Methylobacter sp.]